MSSPGSTRPLVPPLYQSSVYQLADLDALDQVMEGEEPGFIYARDGHPNAAALAERLSDLEGAAWTLVCSSGMAALSAVLLSSVRQGQRIVASNRLYGRTTQLFVQEASRLGIQTSLVDICQLEEVEAALKDERAGSPRILHVETISNPLLRLADLPKLARLAHEYGCRFVVDNTFATPILCRPLKLGADLVIESLTKMMGGHSDITLGCVCGAKQQTDEQTQSARDAAAQVISIWGLASPPFDCWLAMRSLETLALRQRVSSQNALKLADWLTKQPAVAQVIYPGRPEHADHALAGTMLAGSSEPLFGNMLCLELTGGREAVNRFMRQAPEIPFSPSLGHTTTTCSHPATTSHRYVSLTDRKKQGISDGLVRLSVGIEEIETICQAMARGLKGLS